MVWVARPGGLVLSRRGFFPVLGRFDLGVYVRVDFEQVQQVAAGQQFQGFVFGEVE